MSDPLVVVGLLSGGKDSCYNLCHCVKQGHRVAALATLSPPLGKDELDSYMYQTVGHDAVHLIAEAMELPLYRGIITGQAVNQTSTYGQRLASSSSHTLDESDETEDLYRLLCRVKEAQPEINAVSVGAILSNYQRVRVEHVALRANLQLLPLSYLWQRDQRELLDEMCQAGMNSVLIKVAGAGLEEGDLGKSLAQMRPKFHKLNALYGAHICGEGGEYETLTLDCPLFKKKIVLDKTTTVVHSDSSFASVFYLQVNGAHLEPKVGILSADMDEVIVPPLLDSPGQATCERCEIASRLQVPAALTTDSLQHSGVDQILLESQPSIAHRGHWCAIGTIKSSQSSSIEEEFHSAFNILMDTLSQESLSPAHLSHINAYLTSQEHFSTFNNVYRAYFGVDPPSRACVAVNSGKDSPRLILDAVLFNDGVIYDKEYTLAAPPHQAPPRSRKVLHVQGRSFWAAANIGPYSQSVNAGGRISIAGQIGLIPSTLQLTQPVPLQIALALQHARRIFKATLEGRVEKQRGWIEGCVCWVDDVRWLKIAQEAWRTQVDDKSDLHNSWEAEWLGLGMSPDDIPVTFAVLPEKALPRSAAVEWQLFGHDGSALFTPSTDDTTDDQEDLQGEAPAPSIMGGLSDRLGIFACSWKSLHSKAGGSALGIAHLSKSDPPVNPVRSTLLHSALRSALSVKVLFTKADDASQVLSLLPSESAAITLVPVCGCFDAELRPCDVALLWQSIE